MVRAGKYLSSADSLLQTLAKCPFLWHFLHSASQNLQVVDMWSVSPLSVDWC